MSITRLRPIRIIAAAFALVLLLSASSAAAQTQSGQTVRVVRASVALEQPRGDSIPVGSVQPGDVLELLDRQGNWFLVVAPTPKTGKATWDRGWIHVSSLEPASADKLAPSKQQPRGRLMIRGFGLAGGTLFTAQDSFDTILGESFGPLFGGGGQVVFPNGVFAQVGIERFRETGTRALVSGEQVFTVDFPEQVTITPINITAGYRAIRPSPLTGYLGVGFGWHKLEEQPLALPTAERISTGHAGFHILGGAEYAILPWVWLAGEVQWATVPKALGETGVSAFYEEDDLGGTTFRFKLVVGR